MVISFLTYRALSFLIGVLYPAYRTYKAIKYQHCEQHLSLLCYWLVFGLFHVGEFLFDHVLSLIVPFFYELKLIFVVCLSYSDSSQVLFYQLVVVYVDRYEHDIDYVFKNTIHRSVELFVKLMLLLANQQRTGEPVRDAPRAKTNFASQYRRFQSLPRT